MMSRLRSRLAFIHDVADRTLVERHYRRAKPPIAHGAKQAILVEGLWDNPNHWLRLWIFLHAYLKDNRADVIGVLRSRDNWDNWRKRKSLEALGIRRFTYLDEVDITDADRSAAVNKVLEGVSDFRQVLGLQLPDGLPGYVLFDSVLKIERHPQPRIEGNPAWQLALDELVRFQRSYADIFDQNEVVAVVSSHAWKSEWATLCWTALRRNVPFFYMTAHYDSIRVRRMNSVADYLAPNEHLPYEQFKALPPAVQDNLIERGQAYLADRFSGNSDFLVLRCSVDLTQRTNDRAVTFARLGLPADKPLVVIYAHSWFDFPHTQGMTNFTEPLDWIKFTIAAIAPLTNVSWAVKPHPCDRWYGGVRMQDFVNELPPHVKIIPDDCDSLAVQQVADALVTIQGSIAIEGAAMGNRVLCADRSTYTDWGFAHTALSREDYADKLGKILELAQPTEEQSRHAMAYAALALAPPPQQAQWLRLSCDSRFLEGTLYPEVRGLLTERSEAVDTEVEKMRQWFKVPFHSYNAWRTIDCFMPAESVLQQ